MFLTCKEVHLEEEHEIQTELNLICEKALADFHSDINPQNIATNYKEDGRSVYKSYRWKPEDLPQTSLILVDQGLLPLGYLSQVIVGHEQNLRPHRDKRRHVSILYPYTEDGSVTRFYDEVNEPDEYFWEFDDVIETESHVLEKGKFYLFNHQHIHAVTDIKSLRCNVTIDLAFIHENDVDFLSLLPHFQ